MIQNMIHQVIQTFPVGADVLNLLFLHEFFIIFHVE